jgi:two-component system CheB/CheR fusion protein
MSYRSNSDSEAEFGVADKFLYGTSPARSDDDDERSRQIALVAHELRNSLAVIRNAARLLQSPSSAGTVDTARSLIERHVGHMSRHIEDLLEPQPRGARGREIHRSHVDLRTIARYAADAISPELARRGHRLAVKLPEEPVWAHADGTRLEQVFCNLLINAAKYTPNGGDLGLLMERNEESVYVRIRDSGVGLEPAMLSRVFGMFFQVPTALPKRENGHGIGLAVVRDVIEQHGGTVTATSAGLGLGSEFTIVLPSLWARRSVIIAP